MKIVDVAKIVYQANVAYHETFEPWQKRKWGELAEHEQASYINGVKFFLKNPDAPEEKLHNVWMKTRIMEGWSYDEKYDPFNKVHPYLKPFKQLRPEQQFKDYLFKGLLNLFINIFHFEIEE